MTDNEKRAHDMAIALLPGIAELKTKERAKVAMSDFEAGTLAADGNVITAGSIDYFDIYKETYEAALAAFNREFPG